DLIQEVLARIPEHRVQDVILFDPADVDYPFGLNLFECKNLNDPKLVDRVCSEIILTFKKLFPDNWGPRMEDLMRHSVLTLIATPDCTLLDMLSLLTHEEARKQYAARTSDPVLRHYWQQAFPDNRRNQGEWVSSSLNKIGRFLTNPVIRNIVAQPKSTFDFRSIMDEGKVLLVNLSKGQLGEDNSGLIGSVLIGKILIAALSRSEVPPEKRRPFHLIVDEYHSFATESFPTLQSEGRKFGIDTIVAHQYRDQLDTLNKGSTLNVGNFILFRLTGRDAEQMAMQFDNSPPDPEPLLKSVPYRTGREGVYRTGGDKVLVKGSSRSYGDVANETANYLANVPNYRAYTKLIEGTELAEYFIQTEPCQVKERPEIAQRIKQNSRRLARSRQEVEASVVNRFAPILSTDGAGPKALIYEMDDP
ncbi:MAG TPA: type IV secretory system conjugative DNA transfer family protein, partial [Dehalococcoidia bacterium]|nr:type IV secretory system conjugative DNA transfer family protein [Dehalococcoidia bacterium]